MRPPLTESMTLMMYRVLTALLFAAIAVIFLTAPACGQVNDRVGTAAWYTAWRTALDKADPSGPWNTQGRAARHCNVWSQGRAEIQTRRDSLIVRITEAHVQAVERAQSDGAKQSLHNCYLTASDTLFNPRQLVRVTNEIGVMMISLRPNDLPLVRVDTVFVPVEQTIDVATWFAPHLVSGLGGSAEADFRFAVGRAHPGPDTRRATVLVWWRLFDDWVSGAATAAETIAAIAALTPVP